MDVDPAVTVAVNAAVTAVQADTRAHTYQEVIDHLQHLLNFEADLARLGKPSQLTEMLTSYVAALRTSADGFANLSRQSISGAVI